MALERPRRREVLSLNVELLSTRVRAHAHQRFADASALSVYAHARVCLRAYVFVRV
jgi:hypothetical protein